MHYTSFEEYYNSFEYLVKCHNQNFLQYKALNRAKSRVMMVCPKALQRKVQVQWNYRTLMLTECVVLSKWQWRKTILLYLISSVKTRYRQISKVQIQRIK